MGHHISGIITSFKYQGDLPYLYLIGNYAFIPLNRNVDSFKGYPLEPFDNLTPPIKKLLKELSFTGRCAFIETDFFGGSGTQVSVVYDKGKITLGPLTSRHKLSNNFIRSGDIQVLVVDEAINQALQFIGIISHAGKDEFNTARLGAFRDNQDVLDEINGNVAH